MDLVLCHTTADFDTLGAAVGVSCLRPGSRIVLTGGAHPTVQAFLSLWQDEYPLVDRRAVSFEHVRSLTLVDAIRRDRFAPVKDWFDQAAQKKIPIYIYDHHAPLDAISDATAGLEDWPTAHACIEPVGAATTLLVEALQREGITPTPSASTVMALGIHSDTGSLTFGQSTARDGLALAWLMANGANQSVIAENINPGLSPQLQDLLVIALDTIQSAQVRGHHLAWLQLETTDFVPGLSGLAERLMSLLGLDTLLLYGGYQAHQATKAVIIGRSRTKPAQSRVPSHGQSNDAAISRDAAISPDSIDLQAIFAPLGGGGHAQAASVVLKAEDHGDLHQVFAQLLAEVRSRIPHAVRAQSLMSSPVRTILPTTTVEDARRTLLRYGHVGLCVVNADGDLIGMVSRRDIDIALHHGLGHAPVKGCMSSDIKSITPSAPLSAIQSLMMTYDIGRLPVLDSNDDLVGIVTRTDLLRQLHLDGHSGDDAPADDGEQRLERSMRSLAQPPSSQVLHQQLEHRLLDVWPALTLIAEVAEQNGWALYLVGGAVRDLLLSLSGEPYPLKDIDLVVDGAGSGAGVALAEAMQASYPQVTVQIHGQFQTASLVWHSDQALASATTEGAQDTVEGAQDTVEGAQDTVVPSAEIDSEPPLEATAAAAQPLLIDIATARTEFYPYPAANPEVESSTIRQDLYRRDFTINAMALRLNGPERGQLLDLFGGWLDLLQRHVRVLHSNSFIEDPTRIFRAVKFAVRLDFSLDGQSERFIRHAISSGIYSQAQVSDQKTPALQTRLKAELKQLLTSERWMASLAYIDALGAWACLHPSLKITPALRTQLRRMARWMNKFDVDGHALNLSVKVPLWLMLLELIIAQLDPGIRGLVAQGLDLPTQSCQRLERLQESESVLLSQLSTDVTPSRLYGLLKVYALPELLLLCDRHPYTLGRQIWQYIVRLSRMPALIDGGTLKRLGYRPGPQFRDMLTAVHGATLDGEVTTPQGAEAYVLNHYPH
ncbi:MAG: CBS domain-containing protein [Cyanobacteria bacterium J06598_3]